MEGRLIVEEGFSAWINAVASKGHELVRMHDEDSWWPSIQQMELAYISTGNERSVVGEVAGKDFCQFYGDFQGHEVG